MPTIRQADVTPASLDSYLPELDVAGSTPVSHEREVIPPSHEWGM